jgi:hypothetical protein
MTQNSGMTEVSVQNRHRWETEPISRRLRAQVGYRFMRILGASLAGGQAPYSFGLAYELKNSDVNGSLLLQDMHYGSEFCF